MKTIRSIFFIVAVLLVCAEAQAGGTTVFSDSYKEISVSLPSSWFGKTEGDTSKTLQLFVSREKIEKPTDMFQVGMTATKVRNMSKVVDKIKADSQIAILWVNASRDAEKNLTKAEEKQIVGFRNGIYGGFLREVVFQPKPEVPAIHKLEVILSANDNLIDIVFEAPETEWSKYETIYKDAIKSLHVQ